MGMAVPLESAAAPRRVPGEAGVWILIFGDLTVFGLLFGTFGYYGLMEPAVFHASQPALNQSLGLLNTLLLLTSSLFVVKAVGAWRRGDHLTAPRWVLGAIVLGVGFGGVKAIEYGEKIAIDILPTTNNFYMLYFILTGIHLIHVIVGLAALTFLRNRVARPLSGAQLQIVESCAIFWHMVDVLWVILFAIFYLHR